MPQTIIVGIDLGTCNSCMAILFENEAKVIETRYGKTTPSIVSFNPIHGFVTVGQVDWRHISNCIYDAKRFIGKFPNDVRKIRGKYPFKVDDSDGKLCFKIKQKRQDVFKSPEEIGAEILKYFKDCLVTDFYIGTEQEDINIEAVITVPAYFHVLQKEATMKAAELAGIKVLQLMPEPSAAAAFYCSIVPEAELGLCLVFDLGGGTFDISCVDIRSNEIIVKFIDGDNFLGGVNFDEEIVEYFKNKFLIERQIELDDMQLFRLRGVAKSLKESLSTEDYFQKTLDDFLDDSRQEQFELTRDKFDELNKHWFNRCIDIVKFSFERNNVNKNDIKRVILVGGSTKIRRIRQSLAELFGEEKIYDKLNPDECVAAGAALNARNLRFNTTFEDTDEGKVISQEMFKKFKDLNKEDNNSEEPILPFHSLDIINVCPMDISVDSSFNCCEVVIRKNSSIPIEKNYVWQTCRNGQELMEVSVYEGSYKNKEANTFLGKLTFSNLPKAEAGKVKIYGTFGLDLNGILNIYASYENSDDIKSYVIDLNFDRIHFKNQIIYWNREKDEEFEALAILQKLYYYLVQRLANAEVIKTVPVIIISDILKDKSITDILESMQEFFSNNSDVNSRYMEILREVYNIYTRNSSIEEKRQKLIEVKSLDEN